MYFLAVIVSHHTCAQLKLNLHNSWGFNLVDLEKATGSPEFDENLPADTRQLVEWDRFYYNGEVQLLKTWNEGLDLGVGLGFNRLYYWEERYRNLFDTQFQFDYGTIWTLEVSVIANYNFGDWFLHASPSLQHFFWDDTYTAGLALGVGRTIPITETLTIPVVLKNDLVFGNATTIAPSLGLGIQLAL